MQQESLPTVARDAFYSAVDGALRIQLPDKIDDAAAARIEAIVVLLGAVYGWSREEMVGNSRCDDACTRFNTARGFAVSLRDRGFTPKATLYGIRRCPVECPRFPTFGMLVELIAGETIETFPGNRPQAPAGLTDNNVFEQLARAWEGESRRLGVGPVGITPQEVGRRRMRDLREMWDSHGGFKSIPRAHATHAEHKARADAYRRAAATDRPNPQPVVDDCPV
jgi:hypothetical protein